MFLALCEETSGVDPHEGRDLRRVPDNGWKSGLPHDEGEDRTGSEPWKMPQLLSQPVGMDGRTPPLGAPTT